MGLMDLFKKPSKQQRLEEEQERAKTEDLDLYPGMRVEVTTDDGRLFLAAELMELRGNMAKLKPFIDGSLLSRSDQAIPVTIRGKSSHGGSAPDEGIDAIMIASYVVAALQSIVARNVSPLKSTVISIGTIRGGTRYNVVADEVVLEGTCRNLDLNVRDTMPGRIENIIKGVTEGMGGSYEFRYVPGYSPTVNDPEMYEIVRDSIVDILGEDGLIIPEYSSLGGEGFSFYSKEVPCAFFWLGCHDESKPLYPIHHGSFAPAEEALPVGMEVMVSSALKFLAK